MPEATFIAVAFIGAALAALWLHQRRTTEAMRREAELELACEQNEYLLAANSRPKPAAKKPKAKPSAGIRFVVGSTGVTHETESAAKAFIYINAAGEVLVQRAVHAVDNGPYLLIDYDGDGPDEPYTFRKDRILAWDVDQDLANDQAADIQDKIDNGEWKRQPHTWPRTLADIEICFLGFKAPDKARLSDLATAAGYTVRSAVAYGLEYACVGPSNRRTESIAKARNYGALILTEAEFIGYLNDGELPLIDESDTKPGR